MKHNPKTPTQNQLQSLHQWYLEHKRPLPWRTTKDAYSIWISETMLQQTTTQVVIPYFEKFLKEFPTLQDLAAAPEARVLERWSGLGYYSRARNLHNAAKELSKLQSFPRSYKELITFKGFGPYTSRAVASLAFEEPVGVLDGNVIRVLTRVHDLDLEWWKTKERELLQRLSDEWVRLGPASEMNQALMELGATICTPKSPSCLLCPLKSSCLARRNQTIPLRPKSKPRKKKTLILWKVSPFLQKDQILLQQEHLYPVLKSQPMPLGKMETLSAKPKLFHFKHTITDYEIFVHVDSSAKRRKADQGDWVSLKDLAQVSPSSLVRKVVSFLESQKNL